MNAEAQNSGRPVIVKRMSETWSGKQGIEVETSIMNSGNSSLHPMVCPATRNIAPARRLEDSSLEKLNGPKRSVDTEKG